MDQEKIGKFIAKCRKEKDITQQELAEKLGITDKAISKWENGRCLPDISFLEPLAKELNVSINELIKGDRIEKKNIVKEADDNLKKSLIEVKKSKSSIKGLKAFVGLLIICFVLIIGLYFFTQKKILKGDVSSVILEIGESRYHNNREINKAVESFEDYFKIAYYGSKLSNVEYQEFFFDSEVLWKKDYFPNCYDLIVLKVNILTNDNDEMRENVFYYIMIKKTENGFWEVGTASKYLYNQSYFDQGIEMELYKVNKEIINYFSSSDATYSNYAFNYIDHENKVVVVGLKENSEFEQERFKKMVVYSRLLKFVEGSSNIDTLTVNEVSDTAAYYYD